MLHEILLTTAGMVTVPVFSDGDGKPTVYPTAVYVQGDGGAPQGPTPSHMNPRRVVPDQPPTWDGSKPDDQAAPYLKMLQGWLNTSATLKSQQGMIIMNYATGDLRLIIDELTTAQLTSEDGGQKVFNHISASYVEYIDKKLPKTIENALFRPDCRRTQDEIMVQYISRKSTLFNALAKAECVLPEAVKGYLLMRDAKLSDKAWDTVETWTENKYEWTTVTTALRKLGTSCGGTRRITGDRYVWLSIHR